jgi:uncharacterized membrane protein
VGVVLLVTLIRGVLFLVPIVLVALLAKEAYRLFHQLFAPVARMFPAERFVGILLEDLVTLAAITLVFLIAGLFVATRPGRVLSDRLERTVLYRVPGYLMVRGAVGSFPGMDAQTDEQPQPVLVETDEGWAFALQVEPWAANSQYRTVFLPDSPSATSGAVRIVQASRVRSLPISTLALLSCLTRSGAGAEELAGPVLKSSA